MANGASENEIIVINDDDDEDTNSKGENES